MPAKKAIFSRLEQGFREQGYVVGKSIILEHRFPAEAPQRFESMALELASLKLDAIVASATRSARAVQKATPTTPIVFVAVGDPVSAGLVKSLAHPGGNATGLANASTALSAKRLQLLKEAIPSISRLGVLAELDTPTKRASLEEMQAAARAQGLTIRVFEISNSSDIGPAFSSLAKERLDGLVVLPTGITYAERARIAELAIKHKVPTMASYTEASNDGALMSYAPSLTAQFRRVAIYVDRIIKGAAPGSLPVELPTKFEFVVNRRTAKALNVELAPSAFARADRVIE